MPEFVMPPAQRQGALALLQENQVSSTNAKAVNQLGEDYYFGKNGQQQDRTSAAALWAYAVEQFAHTTAMVNLANCYRKGTGVDPNLQRAIQLYQAAVDLGNANAMFNLANCYRKGTGVDPNLQPAIQLYQAAVDLGNANAMFNLAVCYENGTGVDPNLQRAIQLYQAAVDLGNASAMVNLALCYQHGNGIKQDVSRAVALFQQGVDKDGNKHAHIGLAEYYLSLGTDSAITQAKHHLEEALGMEEKQRDFAVVLFAELLCSSTENNDLEQAKELISKSNFTVRHEKLRAQWLETFIDDQLANIDLFHKLTNRPKHDMVASWEIQLVAKIGMGQFGMVYLAWFNRRDEGRWVAVKFLNSNIADDPDEVDTVTNTMRERFACRVAAACSSPSLHMVDYIGFVSDEHSKQGLVFGFCGDVGDKLEKAKEYITENPQTCRDQTLIDLEDWTPHARTSLRSFIVHANIDRDRFPVSKIVDMLLRLCITLGGLHKLGFLHRDMADRNALCNGEGDVKLADLGLAKFCGEQQVNDDIDEEERMMEYAKAHKPGHQYAIAWMAPESIVGRGGRGHYSTKSDVYSFGMMMWQCFAHNDPFYEVDPTSQDAADEIKKMILEGRRPRLEDLDEDVPASLSELIHQCWAEDPHDRPTVKALSNALGAIVAECKERERSRNRRADTRLNSVECQAKWFDTSTMYLKLEKKPVRPLAPPQSKPQEVRNSFWWKFRPLYDVFLVHTGKEKWVEVDVLKTTIEQAGLKCFADYEMEPRNGGNTHQMRSALKTCRYTFVVVSKQFLERRHPCEELIYAYQRNQWLRRNGYLESLRVVFYRISMDDYEAFRRKKRPDLPVLKDDTVLYLWDVNMRVPWLSSCTKYVNELERSDRNGELRKWRALLRDLNTNKASDFPDADWLYGAQEENTSSCCILL